MHMMAVSSRGAVGRLIDTLEEDCCDGVSCQMVDYQPLNVFLYESEVRNWSVRLYVSRV